MRKGASGGYNKITPNRKIIRKSASRQDLRGLNEKITLKHILGLTTTNTNGLACNSVTGIFAYPAGCVIVLYNIKNNIQSHIFNPDKKTITCLAFSSDGKYLVSGESGQQPSVRVWDLNDHLNQIAELRGHKSGVTSVEFSPNNKLLVSIGDQHDMLVNVWNWKLGHTVACNKSGCRVRSVSFSETGNYLVTVGNRHVKFWYLDQEASSKGNAPITPITGRAGILGDQRNNCFTDVKCGRGKNSRFTYCVTKSSMLCMFNERRIMDKWVELKAGSTNCLEVTEDFIFCGCSDGLIRVFDPSGLRFIATFPRPHNLGVNVSDGLHPTDLAHVPTKSCPNLVALSVDITHNKMASIYNDHSMYVWDIKNIKKVGKVASFLYHSACIWGIETYPFFDDNSSACLPYGSFLTCSSDDTIRIWNIESGNTKVKMYPRNLYSKELLKIVYIDEGLTNIQDTSMAPFGKDSDSKTGIRCMQISPNGQLLATGDRSGNLRIYSLEFFDEKFRIEAHESEILCVEFSPDESGYQLLASSSRDRLIHIFDISKKYTLLQTIDDHSSSITAVRFNFDEGCLQMLSCGADKVVMFHTAQTNDNGVYFVRNTIVPGKATLYDMGIEPTRKYAATVGQDRNMRIYDIQGAKQLNCFKGSFGEEGNLIKFQLDAGGVYAAISCSDKTIGVFEFENGECEASMYGHSDIATGLKFTADGKHLISVSGDGCIFVWNLPPVFTENIRNRLQDLNAPVPLAENVEDLRRKTFVVSSSDTPKDLEESSTQPSIDSFVGEKIKTPAGYRFSVGQLPLWAQKQIGGKDTNGASKAQSQPLGRWGEVGLNAVAESNTGDAEFSEESVSMEDEVIYPPFNEDISTNDLERTFHVTESHDPNSSNEHIDQNGDLLDEDFENLNGKESDGDPQSGSEVESDREEAFSPLMDHFEELATPAKTNSQSTVEELTSSSDQLQQSQQSFIPGHRASISAKFLSRSQKSSSSSSRTSSNSTATAEEQRRRLEHLKHKLNNPPSTNALNEHHQPQSHPSTTNIDVGGGNNTALRSNRRVSGDASNLSPKTKARSTLTNTNTNLKKSKMISRSCVNLSFTQELDEIRKEKFKNTIPNTPSATSINDILTNDPRRSSTPLNVNKQKWKRRSSANAWATSIPTSPLGSPLSCQKSISVTNLLKSPTRTVDSVFHEPDSKPTATEHVIRRSGGKRGRARPRSMLVEPVSMRDENSEIAIITPSHQKSQSLSDTEADDSKFQESVFTSASLNNKSTPVKNISREIDIDEQLNHSLRLNTSKENDPVIVTESEAERARRVANEIKENVRQLALQQQQQTGHQCVIQEEDIDQQRDAKQLIRLYETGLIGGNGKVISSSPPERDVPPPTPIREDNIPPEFPEASVTNIENGKVEEATCNPIDEDLSGECTKKMQALVQSFVELTELEDKLSEDRTNEQNKQLLALIDSTYDTLQQTITERKSRLNHVTEFTKNNVEVLQSDSYKDFREALHRTKVPESVNDDADVMNLLDKYSNILVDMIGSKMAMREPINE